MTSTPQPEDGVPLTVPVIREELLVGKSLVEVGAVRIRLVTDSTVEQLDVPLGRDEVSVERVPFGTPVDAPRAPWQDGDVWVVPVYEEVLVTERRLMLKEELRLTRRRIDSVEHREVALQRQRAVIERRSDDGSWVELESEDPSAKAAPPA